MTIFKVVMQDGTSVTLEGSKVYKKDKKYHIEDKGGCVVFQEIAKEVKCISPITPEQQEK